MRCKGMIILRIRRLILLLMIFASMMSCNNDLVVMAPYQVVPVVYCVLNPKDQTQYLRLEKSFLGEASALDMAQQTDSIYYKDASVFIERWADGEMKEQLGLERIEAPVRDSGIFTNNPNYLYHLTTPILSNREYRLKVVIPSSNIEITASTRTVGDFKVVRPEAFKRTLPFSSYDNYQTVQWISTPYTRIYHLMVRFHYLEVISGDTTFHSLDWNIGHYITADAQGGELMTSEILQRNFYKWIGNKLTKPDEKVQRLANKKAIDFVFTVGSEELYTYMEIYKEDPGLPKEKPVFTNITNGIGLFSAKYEQSILGKALSDHSVDSLAHGIYTKHLRFADSQNDYYYN